MVGVPCRAAGCRDSSHSTPSAGTGAGRNVLKQLVHTPTVVMGIMADLLPLGDQQTVQTGESCGDDDRGAVVHCIPQQQRQASLTERGQDTARYDLAVLPTPRLEGGGGGGGGGGGEEEERKELKDAMQKGVVHLTHPPSDPSQCAEAEHPLLRHCTADQPQQLCQGVAGCL